VNRKQRGAPRELLPQIVGALAKVVAHGNRPARAEQASVAVMREALVACDVYLEHQSSRVMRQGGVRRRRELRKIEIARLCERFR